MLSEYPIDVMLLATDLDVARDFYGRKLGLEILSTTTSSSPSVAGVTVGWW